MLDYAALHCFSEVLRFGGFDKGAQVLNLTQSAVSQKIKRLEQQVGGPVLVRTKPVTATPLGRQLLVHYQKVSVLEESLSAVAGVDTVASPLSVAINNDVLATWFASVMKKFAAQRPNPVHVYNADQTQTRQLLQQGEVMACISQIGTPVTGGQSVLLGNMNYQLYASPDYINRYLGEHYTPEAVMAAPGLLYDEYDVTLLGDYQQSCLNMRPRVTTCHWYPSSHGFVNMAVEGVAWALLPTLQITKEIAQGRLIPLFPQKHLAVSLFWHWISLESDAMARLSQAVKQVAKSVLTPHQ
ncbi:ArgP/LysG family DNA-binding transcriptional regulator [Alteromonas sp. C1M14]|uniref:ArgP/LysG family DNA-binding transcriptional regulator n=1 Tax=Alteromonas sp. C1M14 TaxID=2841567 RepID=UPI001C088851|nr:ArgP/LysG family DNA-binding transcriptional regulator [Alteromonas sp. C1M14]MBU2977773.1 ArgP/LysG family DNA-binding transcriptional regulator [Alteromonas sp. C1M14]